MTYYYDEKFLKKLDNYINIIFEVGARYGDESIKLSKIFPNSQIFSFECNPLTLEKCRNNLSNYSNINFIPQGLGLKNEILPFYSYMINNDGASSFLKRIDCEETQKLTGYLNITTIYDIVNKHNISQIDLLAMDVQGFELNILKGAGPFIKKIRYIILEEPKKEINTQYLPDNIHSKYIDAPKAQEISSYLMENGFIEIERLEENKIEDNVMYKNINY